MRPDGDPTDKRRFSSIERVAEKEGNVPLPQINAAGVSSHDKDSSSQSRLPIESTRPKVVTMAKKEAKGLDRIEQAVR